MSEETKNEQAEEIETAPAEGEKKASSAAPPPSLLSRPSDMAARPGFRNPANSRSKASKGQRKKKR